MILAVGIAAIVGIVLLVRRGIRRPSSTVDASGLASAGEPPPEVSHALPALLAPQPITDPAGGQIVVEHLTKHYGSVHAVNDISFTVAPGRITGFLGPNGAGKTT